MNTYLFVYGTLMRGESRNNHLKCFGSYVKDVKICGFKLYHNTEGVYPVARRTDDVTDIVVGELWELRGNSRTQYDILHYLDYMEGVPVLYHRMTVTVEPGVKAVMYCGNWETWKECLGEGAVYPSGVKWSEQGAVLL